MTIYKTAIWMTIAILGSKLIGFVREILFANYYGVSYISDAYVMAVAIPTIIVGGIFTTVAISYIPIYSDIHEKEGHLRAEEFTNKLVNTFFLVLIFIAVLGIAFSKEIVGILASGFKGQTFYVTVYFVKVTFINMIASSLTGIFSSYLQYHNRFVLQIVIGYAFNAILLISIILSGFFSYLILIWGLLVAQVVQLLLIIWGAAKNGYHYKLFVDFKDRDLKKLVLVSFPIFIGSTASQINTFVDKMLASGLPKGSIAALNYGSQINSVVYGLLTMAGMAIIFPLFSKQAASDCLEALQDSVIKSLNLIIILIIPISVGLILLRVPIIQVVYQRGVFDEIATQMTSITLFYFTIGMIGMGVRDVLSKAFFSLSDTKTPMINGIICMLINIVLNLLLIKRMGIGGLALSTSLASIFSAIFMMYSFFRRYKSEKYKTVLTIFVKVIVASFIMGGLIYLLDQVFIQFSSSIITKIVGMAVIISTGMLSYYFVILFEKVEEVKCFKEIISRRNK